MAYMRTEVEVNLNVGTRPSRPDMPHPPAPLVARRVNGERVVILGWSRAVLLQLAHPLIAAGLVEHSTFRGGAAAAARRSHGTVRAMLSLTFGDDAAREDTLARIRRIHERVRGRLPHAAGPFPAGTPYRADDPDLLLWVHATLLESIVDIYLRVVGPLTRAELDAFCAQAAATLLALGGDAGSAPRTWADLRRCLDRTLESDVLVVTPPARAIAHAVLTPAFAGVLLPGAGLHRLMTIGLLPAPVRAAYGFRWDAARARQLATLFSVLRRARRFAPDVLARWRAGR